MKLNWQQTTKLRRLFCTTFLYYIAVIGEAVKRLSPDFRSQHPDIPWTDIAGMRDKVIHQYDRVKLDVVWNTVQEDIPELLRLLKPLLPTPPP